MNKGLYYDSVHKLLIKGVCSVDELKEALITKIKASTTKSSIKLFQELLEILYSKGFSDGIKYAEERFTGVSEE